MAEYDGRISELCKEGCIADTCAPSWSDPYGCGGCCGCRGGCEQGWAEQVEEEASAAQ